VIRITGKPHSGTLPEATQGNRRNDDRAAHPEAAKPDRADGQEPAVVDQADAEQPALSEEFMAELRSMEAMFGELSASERRVLLAQWVIKLHQRIGYFRCIDELTAAFIEVQRGLTPPLFRPIERPGRPALPLIEEDKRSAAALALEALMEASMSKQDAARVVARRLGYSAADREAWREVARWRDDLARAASDRGRYSDDFRVQAKIHEMQRVHLFCAIKNRGEDPRALAEKELTRIDQIRGILNREKGEDFSPN